MMMDHGFGIPLEKSGAMCFFGFQAVGMLIEDSIQRVIPTRLSGDTVWKRWIGYAWILVFFIWSNWFWVNPLVWQLYQAGVALPTPFLIPGSYRILALGGSSRQR